MEEAVGSIDAAENRVLNAFFALAGDSDNEVFAADADQAILELDVLISQEKGSR
jgi:hypothetical protein